MWTPSKTPTRFSSLWKWGSLWSRNTKADSDGTYQNSCSLQGVETTDHKSWSKQPVKSTNRTASVLHLRMPSSRQFINRITQSVVSMWISPTLEATIEVIDSMTRGVHFYCNGVKFIGAHTATIAHSLVWEISHEDRWISPLLLAMASSPL